jgi:hypothetical protein
MSFSIKKIPFLILGFFIIQIFTNLNGSLTAFPFLHYGMFSEKINYQAYYETIQIEVNGQLLKGSDFSIQNWEMIQNPLLIHKQIQQNNDFEKDKMYIHFFLNKLGLSSIDYKIKKHLDNVKPDPAAYGLYYKKYLEKILDRPISRLNVNLCYFAFRDKTYHLLSKKIIVQI